MAVAVGREAGSSGGGAILSSRAVGLVWSVLVACIAKKRVKEMTVRSSPNQYIIHK